ncbi:MAG: alpha/beta hydrolase, partial [Promethearchaeota archaeon]
PVVRMLYKAFGNLGYPSLRFNFRGVGNSDGISGNGAGEREDLISVCKFLLNGEFGIKRILIIGYSFGATIAASVASEFDEIIGYIAISYPFSFIPQFISYAKVNKPKFFIIGDRDDFTTLEVFQKEYKEMPEPKDIKIFSGVDHFWSGNENKLTETIIDWFNNNFK